MEKEKCMYAIIQRVEKAVSYTQLDVYKRQDYIRDDYDFIVIDCPPSLNMLTVNAMTTADTVLVPIQCEYYAPVSYTHLLWTGSCAKVWCDKGWGTGCLENFAM